MHRLLHTRPNKLEFPKSLPHNTGLVHLSAAVEDPKPEKNQRNTNKSRPSQFRAFFRPPKYRRLSLLLVRAPPGPLLCENYKTAYCGFSICTRTWHLGLTRREECCFHIGLRHYVTKTGFRVESPRFLRCFATFYARCLRTNCLYFLCDSLGPVIFLSYRWQSPGALG